jgi:hypothetical protein
MAVKGPWIEKDHPGTTDANILAVLLGFLQHDARGKPMLTEARNAVRAARKQAQTTRAQAPTESEEDTELANATARAVVLAKGEPEAGTLDHALWLEAKRGELPASVHT